ncbi:GFA family protein [Colwellia sp. MEBiC06753]
MKLAGGCHCGAVRFEVTVDEPIEVDNCNCSICQKSGFLHLIVPKARFNLIQGQDQLTTFTFNTGVAQHYFCKVCGIKPFYIPRSNPDGIDVNFRCLDKPPENVPIIAFDGQNWEQHAHKLAHKSQG